MTQSKRYDSIMCGLAGWLRPGHCPNFADLVASADLMSHRGPDDRGYYHDPKRGIALAHLRLSIIDLSPAGHQPMFNEDRTVALIFNGEIYNFQELRVTLEQAGHHFLSRTDSEVIVHGWEQWGEALVDRLCGMFAFAIWDSRRRRLCSLRATRWE